MRTRTLALLLVVGVVFLSACGGPYADAGSPVGPSVETASFSVTPSTLFGRPAPFASCPFAPPFTVPFTLFVQTGNVSIAINDITMRFTDSFGVPMPQVTLPMPVPTAQIGTALIEARSGRSFPLSFGVGCGTARTGTAVIVIHFRDGRGRLGSSQVITIVQ
jgi:hypothetical protein